MTSAKSSTSDYGYFSNVSAQMRSGQEKRYWLSFGISKGLDVFTGTVGALARSEREARDESSVSLAGEGARGPSARKDRGVILEKEPLYFSP